MASEPSKAWQERMSDGEDQCRSVSVGGEPQTEHKMIAKIQEVAEKCIAQCLHDIDENKAKAEEMKALGDMYGFNYFIGQASGAISCNFAYGKLHRIIEDFIKQTAPDCESSDPRFVG